jgi:tellurite resistance protein TehA-like permease
MLSLVGYASLSLIIVLFLKPFLNIDRSIAAYCFPFGLIYIVLLVSADQQMFEYGWHRYLGISLGVLCEVIFIIGLVRSIRN